MTGLQRQSDVGMFSLLFGGRSLCLKEHTIELLPLAHIIPMEWELFFRYIILSLEAGHFLLLAVLCTHAVRIALALIEWNGRETLLAE